MRVKRKTKIGAISLASLLAAAASIGLVTAAAAGLDDALQERATTLGFDAEIFADLDEGTLAEIVALFEADHDDETLQRQVGGILDIEGAADETAG